MGEKLKDDELNNVSGGDTLIWVQPVSGVNMEVWIQKFDEFTTSKHPNETCVVLFTTTSSIYYYLSGKPAVTYSDTLFNLQPYFTKAEYLMYP